jgi:hypothetical protein
MRLWKMTSPLTLGYNPPFSGTAQPKPLKLWLHDVEPLDMSVPKPIEASPCCAWAKLATKKNPPITASNIVLVIVLLKRDLLSFHRPRMRRANQWDAGLAHAFHLNLGPRICANLA